MLLAPGHLGRSKLFLRPSAARKGAVARGLSSRTACATNIGLARLTTSCHGLLHQHRSGHVRHHHRTMARLFSATPRKQDNYAFIGLGQMGFRMAENLQAKLGTHDTIQLFDTNRAAADRLIQDKEGGPAGGAAIEVFATAAEAAFEADVVLLCLPEPKHVQATVHSILHDHHHGHRQPPHPRLFIDCSTIDPVTSRAAALAVAQHSSSSSSSPQQSHFVDAPMSGGVIGAAAATLTFMVGCPAEPAELLPRVERVLLLMGRRVLHCGSQGAGLVAKLANNYLLAASNVATAGAMQLGVRAGLDPKVLAAVINASTGRCWPSEVNNPVPGVVDGAPAARDYAGGFGVALMRKDLALARVAAAAEGLELPLWEALSGVYERTEHELGEAGRGRDFSVVYKWLEEKAGR